MSSSDLIIFDLTDNDLALAWAGALALTILVGGIIGRMSTTAKLLADFDAGHAKDGWQAGVHPAWWWPLCDFWVRTVEWGNRTLTYELGPPVFAAKYVIDLFKGATPFVMLGLMVKHNNWSNGATTYLALHGSYGVLWVLKSQIIPDPRWETKIPILGAVVVSSWLAMYWVGGISLLVRHTPVSNERCAFAIFLYVCGIVAMLGADGQRHFTLRLKKGLISDGWYARTRNPNYLGEMMLYSSFAVLAQLRLMWVHLLITWVLVFVPNMWWKEQSLRRKHGWEAYAARSGMLIPRLLPARAIDAAPPSREEAAPAGAVARGRSPRRR